jgi:PAS domain S-box-containing protein
MARAREIRKAARSVDAGEAGDDLYRRTFERAASGLAHIGTDRRFIRVNRRLTEILGYSEAELKTLRGREISHPDDVDMINRQRPALYEGRAESLHVEKRYIRKNGETVWVAITIVLERDAAGKPQFEIAVFDDISARKRAEAALRESEERFRQTFELAASGMAHVTLDGHFLRVNRSLCRILGYAREELIGRSVKELSHPEDRDLTDAERARVREGELTTAHFEKRYVRKNGTVVWVDLAIALAHDAAGEPEYEIAVFDDITSRKVLDAALRDKTELLQLGQAAARMIILDYDLKRNALSWSDSPEWLRGPLPASGAYPGFREQVHPEDRERFEAERASALATLRPSSQEYRVVRTDGQVLWVLARRPVLADAHGKAARLLVAMIDVTERKQAEQALRESEARFRSLTQLSSDWYWEQDSQFGLTFMSGRMGERTGLDAKSFLGRKRWDSPALNLTPEDWLKHREQLERHEPFRNFELQRPDADGGSRWIALSGEPLFDEHGHFAGYRGVGSDITERKQAELALREAHEELKRSNAELEQFAYVASHDLQEPLRMVSSYTQLLLRRFGERFDGDSREFMGYIVDGAARMKQLIEDLLAYSRVGTKGKEFREVPVEDILRRAVSNLRASIEEAGAAVSWDPLPVVRGDDMQLTQLFQNLIGNALKFRSASVPRIHVFVSQQDANVHFMVRDNGIGIEPQYFERIFMVFQRLHNKADYPGTGIGLAICKKVVERHGGRVWVESRPGEGSAFHFTLPKRTEGESA